jgi:hypothetical protein
MPVLSFIIWIIVIATWAYVDGRRIKKKKGILMGHHLAAWIARYAVAFLLVLYVAYLSFTIYPDSIIMLVMYGAWAWIVFDPICNLAMGKEIDHVGTTSWLDKFFHRFKNPFLVQMIVKALYLIGSVTLMFVL